jgi:glycosyltransferase involved in cell wall biosynthesis
MRWGGLVAYSEDLMHEQVRRGYEVAYFFSGRYHPFVKRPRLRRWVIGGVQMLELTDSPLYDHGRQPDLELDEPQVEAMLEGVLRQVCPEVVHVHELAGLPSSLFDVVARAGVPVVFTLQDYFPLCSTFKLLDAGGRVCLRRDVGDDCMATTASDPRPPGLMVEGTVRFELLRRDRALRLLGRKRIDALAKRAGATVKPPPDATSAAYQRRRTVNVERLNRVDRLVAMSPRVAEIYSLLGVDDDRIRTLRLTLAHIEKLEPRVVNGGPGPVVFGTLNGLSSAAKGGALLLEAVRIVTESAAPGSFRLAVFGPVNHAFRDEVERLEAVEARGFYIPESLDTLLHDVDVGIVPSIWEEAYGYVGVEFLAKGIPVIGNAIGGIVEYTRDGETGWLNRSRSAQELAEIMLGVLAEPAQAAALNAGIREKRDEIVKPFAEHAGEIEEIYRELSPTRRP